MYAAASRSRSTRGARTGKGRAGADIRRRGESGAVSDSRPDAFYLGGRPRSAGRRPSGHYLQTHAPVREPAAEREGLFQPPFPPVADGGYTLSFVRGQGREFSVFLTFPGPRGAIYPIVGYPRRRLPGDARGAARRSRDRRLDGTTVHRLFGRAWNMSEVAPENRHWRDRPGRRRSRRAARASLARGPPERRPARRAQTLLGLSGSVADDGDASKRSF